MRASRDQVSQLPAAEGELRQTTIVAGTIAKAAAKLADLRPPLSRSDLVRQRVLGHSRQADVFVQEKKGRARASAPRR